jgi:glycosyltransferase involved in cell wall biosynthesis
VTVVAEPAQLAAHRVPRRARPRVAVLHQGFVPTYRVRFYELLNELGSAEYVVFHGDPPSGSGHEAGQGPFDFPNVHVRNRELRAAGRWAIYQPVIRQVMRGPFAAVVLGDEAKFISSLALQVLLQAQSRPVVIWGAGYEKDEELGRVGAAIKACGTRLKRVRTRAADGYLCYTAAGARRLAEAGMDEARISVVRNTLDMGSQVRLHEALRDADLEELRRHLGVRPNSAVVVYIGRIYATKRLGDLVEAVRRFAARDGGPDALEAVVIGDGPALETAQVEARGLGGVHFLGRVSDQARIAEYLRVASALVIPGAVGLALNHAFAHGVPVITRAGSFQGPETEYLEHGANGLMVEGSLDDFIAALHAYVSSDELQRRLAAGALATRDELSLEAMVEAFDEGVRSALEATR